MLKPFREIKALSDKGIATEISLKNHGSPQTENEKLVLLKCKYLIDNITFHTVHIITSIHLIYISSMSVK